jgi:dUTP pyrophosphatase
MLIDKEILALIVSGMIRNYISINTQIQSNGFDLTIAEIMMFTKEWEPRIDFTNEDRRISSTIPILLAGGEYHLEQGIYLFRANEVFETPDNIVGWGMPRSTLSRCGIMLNSAVLDAGYSGHLVFTVYVPQAMTFSKNARFVQMIFFKLNEAPSKLYGGVYKENK